MINEIILSEPEKHSAVSIDHMLYITWFLSDYTWLLPSNPKITNLNHDYKTRCRENSLQEVIFGKIPVWVVVIMWKRSEVLIAGYQLFAVSCSERVADFMAVPSFRSEDLQYLHTLNTMIFDEDDRNPLSVSTAEKKVGIRRRLPAECHSHLKVIHCVSHQYFLHSK